MSFGPLQGVRVLELAGIGPVPFACMVLADLGADVVRVDRPDGRPYAQWHRILDRGRKSIAVDLKHPAGAGIVLRLAEHSDVLVEGFRPGVTERLGIGPQECRGRNRALVYARMTGWGQNGPLARTAGHDINYLALTGALHAIGRAGGPPVPPLNVLGDFAGGALMLVNGILAALLERAGSGDGQVVDVSIVDGVAAMLGMLLSMAGAGMWHEKRGTNLLDTGAPYYDVYLCADGRYVAVGALEDSFYQGMVTGLGLDPARLPDRADPANWTALREIFAARFAAGTSKEWIDIFAQTDSCVTPVLTVAQAVEHPHLASRHTYMTSDGLTQPAPAPRFSRSGTVAPRRAPEPGADTRRVLLDIGLSGKDVEDLIRAGAVRSIDAPAG